MAIKINNKCYKKSKDTNEITFDENIDNCIIYDIPPDRCFQTFVNEIGTITIKKYLCGSSVKSHEYNSIESNEDGEFKNIQIPKTINDTEVTRISSFAFSPYNNFSHSGIDINSHTIINSVLIPNSVTSMKSDSLSYIPSLETINIDNTSDSIVNSPCGSPATVNWLR